MDVLNHSWRCLAILTDFEGGMGLESGFELLHRTDFREERAGVEVPGEAVELGFSSDGIGLHTTIIFIADPAGDADFAGTVHHEPAKTDALDATVHKPAASDGGLDRKSVV